MKYKSIKAIAIALSLMLTTQACHARSSPCTTQSNVEPIPEINALKYHFETYYSSALGEKRTYGIALPPDYQSSHQKHYPVIFLLHGGSGDETDWFKKGNALATLQQLYAAKKLPPSIIITPDGNDLRGRSRYYDPQYIDGPNGQVSTAIGDELVKVIQSRYRTLPAPKFWAIGGLSSGAWGAVNIGLHHLNHFSILISHSGYFKDGSGSQNSPIDAVKKLSPTQRQNLRIYLDVGQNDERFYLKQNQQFHQELERLKISNVLHEFPGSHSWRFWRVHLANSLEFVGKQWQGEISRMSGC
jgi:enterochelin esterase-like enzyme